MLLLWEQPVWIHQLKVNNKKICSKNRLQISTDFKQEYNTIGIWEFSTIMMSSWRRPDWRYFMFQFLKKKPKNLRLKQLNLRLINKGGHTVDAAIAAALSELEKFSSLKDKQITALKAFLYSRLNLARRTHWWRVSSDALRINMIPNIFYALISIWAVPKDGYVK